MPGSVTLDKFSCIIDGVSFSPDMYVLTDFPDSWQGAYTVPDQVREIHHLAFRNCTGLTSIHLPTRLQELSGWTFNSCTALERLEISSASTRFTSIDGVLYRKKGAELFLHRYPTGRSGDFTIPDGIAGIDPHAFEHCSALTGIRISEQVRQIGCYAFRYCTGLSYVHLPEGLKIIDEFAFADCPMLSGLTIPEGLTEIRRAAFSDSALLSQVTIPESVTKIGFYAFYGNTFIRCNAPQFRKLPQPARMYTTQVLLRQPEGLDGEYRDAVGRCVKNYGAKLRDAIIMDDDALALVGYYSFRKKPTLAELNEVVEKASAKEKTQILAAVLELKNKYYPPEAVEAYESDQTDKALGLTERTVTDWRRIFKFAIRKEGITLSEYRGKDPDIWVPQTIGSHPVVAVDLGQLLHCSAPVSEVYIPEGVVRLDHLLMSYARIPKRLHIPASVISIEKIPTGLGRPVIVTPVGSYAWEYAEKQGLTVIPEE